MARPVYKDSINQTLRPRLAKILQSYSCYLLDGELAKNKRQDWDRLVLFAENGSDCAVIEDIPAIDGDDETIRIIKMPSMGFVRLNEICEESFDFSKKKTRKESSGRPVKYGEQERTKARKLHESGLSIRKIAEEMGASAATIQKLLKQ